MQQAGPELLSRLLDDHAAALVLYARQWCRSPEDVVQEALLELVRQPSVPANLLGWLYRVVRNGAISASRADARRTRREQAAAQKRGGWFEPSVGQRLDAEAAAAALAGLPIDERETIVARIWGGLSLAEVAELTETSVSTAHRRYARLLAVRARVQIKEGRFDEAIGTLRTGYALGRHVAEGPTLVNALVGIAISNMMSAELRNLVQQPGAPNLYWALAGLPRPMIDMAKALDAESQIVYLLVPEFGEIGDGDRSPAYWDELLDKLAARWSELGGGGRTWQIRVAMTALALKGYPAARRGLIEWGYSPERVDAMPVPQVVALYTRQTFEDLRDAMFKWFALPYPQAREGLEHAEEALSREGRKREIFPMAALLLPAVAAANLAGARCDREIAVMRTAEALRLYAAGHGGQLPEKLSDVTGVPIPSNPITGEPFGYRRTGSTAVLEAPGPPGEPASRYGLRYEITMEK